MSKANMELHTNEMDQIIEQQQAEQTVKQPTSTKQQDFQNLMQNMQVQDTSLRIRIMTEDLVSRQVSNIVGITKAIKEVDDAEVTKTLQLLLSGYLMEKPE